MVRLVRVAPLVLLGYLAVTDWIDLRPFNDVAANSTRERLQASATNYPPLVLISSAAVPPRDWPVQARWPSA